MKSFTNLRNLAGTLTNNSSSTNLSLMDELINDSYRRICAEKDWPFLQKSSTASTVSGTQFYDLPYDLDLLINVTVTIGSTLYIPRECPNREMWDILNQTTTFQSNFPEYYYIYNGQVGFYPTPSTSTSNAITYNYRRRVVDLSRADYTTGTVDIITNGSTVVTGSGTTWTTPMIGRYLRVTATDAVASSGDMAWYEIATRTSNTVIGLVKNYSGTSLTTGASATYIIGQMPILPEAFHDLPVYQAVEVFYSSINPDAKRAEIYKRKGDELMAKLRYDYGTKTTDPSLHDNYPRPIGNPNLFITL